MTRDEFNDLVGRLKRGDNSALASLQVYQQACVRRLVIRSRGYCNPDLAYDLFIDSVLDFRSNVLKNKVAYQNIPAYLQQICWNKWLEESRRIKRIQNNQTEMQYHYDTQTTQQGEHVDHEEAHLSRLKQVEQAMHRLSEQCRRILYLSIADGMPMAEIAETLGLASADVAKTTKSRCYHRLLKYLRQIP